MPTRLARPALWLLLLALLIEAAGEAPVTRTQEARVLVTAREMARRPPGDWLIPQLNGQTRLRKPPMAYWLSAASFKAFGVSTRAGRLPMVIAGWLTIGLAYGIGRRLIGPEAALLGTGAMAGSWLFFKHSMLAETDVLMTFGLTAAVYAAVRAGTSNSSHSVRATAGTVPRPGRRAVLWYHLAAVAVAFGAMAKGPQAGCFFLFLIVADGRRRPWRGGRTWAFVRSGALATVLVLALPWFVYAFGHAEGGQLTDDLVNSAAGGQGHSGPPWEYVTMLLGATMPWTPLAIGAAVVAGLRWKRERDSRHQPAASASLRNDGSTGRQDGARLLVAWSLAVFVPLLVWGNKQPHYLLPLIPPLMLGVGVALAGLATRARNEFDRLHAAGRVWLTAMVVTLLVVCPAVPIYAWWQGLFVIEDVYECFAGLMLAGVLYVLHRFGRVTLAGVAVTAAAATFFLATDEWMESLLPAAPAAVAADLRSRFPHAHFVFRDEASLPLCFGLGEVVPVVDDAELAALRARPFASDRIVCLDLTGTLQPLPAGYDQVYAVPNGKKMLVVSAADGSPWDPDGVNDGQQ